MWIQFERPDVIFSIAAQKERGHNNLGCCNLVFYLFVSFIAEKRFFCCCSLRKLFKTVLDDKWTLPFSFYCLLLTYCVWCLINVVNTTPPLPSFLLSLSVSLSSSFNTTLLSSFFCLSPFLYWLFFLCFTFSFSLNLARVIPRVTQPLSLSQNV